ncbi:MAG: metallophosphoesterase family protein [Polyangia bacterium]|jgi:uncharacterized protein (TIGR03382 family)|nr:metallophosphoesterase family protein [Polyangia bacterium]
MRSSKPTIILAAFLLLWDFCTGARADGAGLVYQSPGQDATSQVNVSWHSPSADEVLELTKASDPTYSSSMTFGGAALSVSQDTTTFPSNSFYRYQVTLDDLDSGSDYIFRIGQTTFTQDHRFRTAGGFGEFSFIFMSDVHAYPPIQSRVDRAVALVSRATQMVTDLDFIVFTGDLTAHGANYTHWENLAAAPFVRDFAIASTPGNHDYYDTSAATIDDRYFNAVIHNPGNGAPLAPNTTYWFRYNGAIFISMNTEANSTAQLDSQRAWLREVVEANPAQYYIAFAHRAFFVGSTTIVGGGEVRKSTTNYNRFGPLFEELEIDLVLAGDDHVYVRTKPIYGGEVSTTDAGTVYITANQIGDRGRMAASSLGTYGAAIYGGSTESNYVSSVSTITVTDTGIHGQMFDADGVVHDSYTIPARRPPLVDDFDPEAYVNAFSAHVNPPDLSLGILRFFAEGHERVRRIELLDAQAPDAVYASFTPAPGQTEELFGPLVPGLTYQLIVEVFLRDGTTRTAELTLVNRLDPGSYDRLRVERVEDAVLLLWDNHLVASEIDSIDVGVNEDWTASLPGDASALDITEGVREGSNLVTFSVIDRYGDLLFAESLTYTHSVQPELRPEATSGCSGCSSAGAPGSMIFIALLLLLVARRRRGR